MGPWSRCVGGLLAMRMRVGSGSLVQVGGLLAMRMRVGSGTLVQVCVCGGGGGLLAMRMRVGVALHY